jgi:hypothetical protein
MGQKTIFTGLYPTRSVSKTTAATFAKRIERTVAKQAIEVFGLIGGMAGKIFSFAVV